MELNMDTPVKGIDYAKEKIQAGGGADYTSFLAIRRAAIEAKKQLVDETIAEAAPEEVQQWLLMGVTTDCTIWDMLSRGLPVSHNTYYKYRRIFFYLLSRKI